MYLLKAGTLHEITFKKLYNNIIYNYPIKLISRLEYCSKLGLQSK